MRSEEMREHAKRVAAMAPPLTLDQQARISLLIHVQHSANQELDELAAIRSVAQND
jgi:hypothetical protein